MAVFLHKWYYVCCFLWFFLQKDGLYKEPEKADHPFYVSVAEINYNNKDRLLEISCKIFTDDLEKALEAFTSKHIDFSHPGIKNKEAKELNTLLNRAITDYIRQHFQLSLDGKNIAPLEYLGFEHENDAVWSYFQVEGIQAAPAKVTITNTLLYEIYNKQMNLVHMTVNGHRQSTRLNYPDKSVTLTF